MIVRYRKGDVVGVTVLEFSKRAPIEVGESARAPATA
jgi:hypothetical protein